MAEGPLRGIRILDLTHVWAGPLGTRILADLGAEMVKIEAPYGRGPQKAVYTPIGGWIGGEAGDEPWNNNAIFVKLARNSRSVCINLKSEPGRATLLKLVEVADVIIENFSARAMPSLGLDYDTLKSTNPRIIYVTMPGYGSYGPYRDWVAFGPSVEPMSGITNVTGYDKEQPYNTAMALIDPIEAVSLTAAVVTALRQRERTDKGARVEMSLHEAGVSYSGPWLIEHQLGGDIEPIGNRHPQMAPHGVYRCLGDDEWLAVACRDDGEWASLCATIGGDLDPLADLERRRSDGVIIDTAITAWTVTRTKTNAAEELQAAGVSAGAVNTTPDMTSDPQVRHRGYFVPLGPFDTPMPGSPMKLNRSSSSDWTPCPKLGADNASILKEWLDYPDAEIRGLEQAGVLLNKPPT
jgi:crotonobetainyl-CoA:carnitine CoA-transferase CaiB-like acyl-CoA transferase